MLDLNFVRDNLPLVEEMLRQRGVDPAAVLKDFREVDTQRRQAIYRGGDHEGAAEQGLGRHCQAEKERPGCDAAMAETKDLREQIQTLEKTAADLDARLRDILVGHSEPAARERAGWPQRGRECGSPALGHAAEV